MSAAQPTPGQRDCACPRVKHRHGTWMGYCTDDCRCAPCTAAWTRYSRQLRKRRHLSGGSLFIDGIGAARRLQALAACGWGSPDLMTHLNVTSKYAIDQWRLGAPKIHRATHARIAAVYDQLWDQPSPGRYAKKVRNAAARNGYLPPLAWDDDEIDNPAATAHQPPDLPELQPCGTTAAARRHARAGEPACPACRGAERQRRQRGAA